MAKRRHYCYYCKRKRKEDNMQHLHRARGWGRHRWICFECGDSRKDVGWLYFQRRQGRAIVEPYKSAN